MLNQSREETAKKEVGHTEISRFGKVFLCFIFLTIIVTVPFVQSLREFIGHKSISLLSFNTTIFKKPIANDENKLTAISNKINLMHEVICDYEDTIDDASFLRKYSLPWVQFFLTKYLHYGNEKALVGKNQWLFFQPGSQYVTGMGFLDPEQIKKRYVTENLQANPIKAICNFAEQLKKRDIELLIIPVPDKIMYYSDKFKNKNKIDKIPNNLSYIEFIKKMQQKNIDVVDLTDIYSVWKNNGLKLYLKTDTHWTPETMKRSAKIIAGKLKSYNVNSDNITKYIRSKIIITNNGDIVNMLVLPKNNLLYSNEVVTIEKVSIKEKNNVLKKSEILFLGDSFCNIFSLNSMKWGESAGLIEQIQYELQMPIDSICRNDAGAYATRKELSNSLKRGIDRLDGKKIVVWEFAIRELAVGNWELLNMEYKERKKGGFLNPSNKKNKLTVTGDIFDISTVPVPGAVPYKDHIMSLHLTNVDDKENSISNAQAYVYLFSMTNNLLTKAAEYQRGEKIILELFDWAEVEKNNGRINRSELNTDVIFEDPWWGKEIK